MQVGTIRLRGHALAGITTQSAGTGGAGAPTGTGPTAAPQAQADQPPVPGGPIVTRVNTRDKLVAITFDDGPSTPYTRQVLRELRKEDVPATFFVVGKNVRGNEARLRAMQAEGHSLANHSWDHSDLGRATPREGARQLRKTSNELERATGKRPDMFRPPYMSYTPRLAAEASRQGMRTILWDVDTRDWERPGSRRIVSNAVDNARRGSIILMHDAGGDRSQTVKAIPRIIRKLKAEGYTFVTVPQLLATPPRR